MTEPAARRGKEVAFSLGQAASVAEPLLLELLTAEKEAIIARMEELSEDADPTLGLALIGGLRAVKSLQRRLRNMLARGKAVSKDVIEGD